MTQQAATSPLALDLVRNRNPIEIPSSVGHGGGGPIRIPGYYALFDQDGSFVSHVHRHGKIVIENLLQGFDLKRLEHSGASGHAEDHRDVSGFHRSNEVGHETPVGLGTKWLIGKFYKMAHQQPGQRSQMGKVGLSFVTAKEYLRPTVTRPMA